MLYKRFAPIFREKQEKHETWEWREAELEEFLLSEITWSHSKTLLLIDALDECSEPDVRRVVGFLESLSIRSIRTNVTLNICLSSRHYPTVSMKRTLKLVVRAERTRSRYICIYVGDQLKKGDR